MLQPTIVTLRDASLVFTVYMLQLFTYCLNKVLIICIYLDYKLLMEQWNVRCMLIPIPVRLGACLYGLSANLL